MEEIVTHMASNHVSTMAETGASRRGAVYGNEIHGGKAHFCVIYSISDYTPSTVRTII